MTNEFKNYYAMVQEHAQDMVNEIYDDLLDELKETSYGYSYDTWERLNNTFLSEYNNYISISLREAVEVLEQSTRLVTDEAMYVGAGDCKDQVIAMAYWTYRNDLMAEFKLALKSRLQEDIPAFQEKSNKLEEEMEALETEIENKESFLEDLEEDKDNAEEEGLKEEIKKIEKLIALQKQGIEALEIELDKIETELEQSQNMLTNAEAFEGGL
jgi:DNA repair exonuclease SbcCD ATPase subunit